MYVQQMRFVSYPLPMIQKYCSIYMIQYKSFFSNLDGSWIFKSGLTANSCGEMYCLK